MTPRQDWFHKNTLVQSTTFTLATADTTSVHGDARAHHAVAAYRLKEVAERREKKKIRGKNFKMISPLVEKQFIAFIWR